MFVGVRCLLRENWERKTHSACVFSLRVSERESGMASESGGGERKRGGGGRGLVFLCKRSNGRIFFSCVLMLVPTRFWIQSPFECQSIGLSDFVSQQLAVRFRLTKKKKSLRQIEITNAFFE